MKRKNSTKKRTRINDVEIRRSQILDKAIELATTVGFGVLSRDKLAAALDCAPGTVSHHFGTMPQFRRALMRHAIQIKNLAVLAQGLAVKDTHALKAPEILKKKALASLAG